MINLLLKKIFCLIIISFGFIIELFHPSITSAKDNFQPLFSEYIEHYVNLEESQDSLTKTDSLEKNYKLILSLNPNDSEALYNLAKIKGSQGDWFGAEALYKKAFSNSPKFLMAQSSKALTTYQLGKLDEAQSELRYIIRKYPMFADARAALSALLASEGSYGEAKSNWVAAIGLDNRYSDRNWLLEIRQWPPKPVNDLMNFLSSENL